MKIDKKLFKVSVASFAISALSMLFSIWGDYRGNNFEKTLALLISILFWGGLLFGTGLLVIVNAHRKNYEKHLKNNGKKKHHIGILTFFRNKTASIFDIAMFVLFVLFMVTVFVPAINENVILITGPLFLFSVYMHALFNGVNFIYIRTVSHKQVAKS